MLPTCSGPPFFTKEFNIWGANSFVIVDDKPPPSNLPVPSHDFLFLSWSSIQFIRLQKEQVMQNEFLVSGIKLVDTMWVTNFNSGPWLFIWSKGLKSKFLTLIIGLWSSQFLTCKIFVDDLQSVGRAKQKSFVRHGQWPLGKQGKMRANPIKLNKFI